MLTIVHAFPHDGQDVRSSRRSSHTPYLVDSANVVVLPGAYPDLLVHHEAHQLLVGSDAGKRDVDD